MNEETGVRPALAALPKRSAVAQLRPRLPAIEAALAAGVSRETVRQALMAEGIDVSWENLKKALFRLRRETRSEATLSVPEQSDRTETGKSELLGEELGSRHPPEAPAEGPPVAGEVEEPAALRVARALDPARRNAVADQFMKPKPRPLLGTKPKVEK